MVISLPITPQSSHVRKSKGPHISGVNYNPIIANQVCLQSLVYESIK